MVEETKLAKWLSFDSDLEELEINLRYSISLLEFMHHPVMCYNEDNALQYLDDLLNIIKLFISIQSGFIKQVEDCAKGYREVCKEFKEKCKNYEKEYELLSLSLKK